MQERPQEDAGLSIVILPAHNRRVSALIKRIPTSDAWLFREEFFDEVEFVAVLSAAGVEVGLGSLAYYYDSTPEIEGLWVDPAVRGRGYATRLIIELAAESQRRYGVGPVIGFSGPAAERAVRRAASAGAPLDIFATLDDADGRTLGTAEAALDPSDAASPHETGPPAAGALGEGPASDSVRGYGRLELDLSNKSASITPVDGGPTYTWGPDVTHPTDRPRPPNVERERRSESPTSRPRPAPGERRRRGEPGGGVV